MKVGVLASTIFCLMIGFPAASFAGLSGDADNDGVADNIDSCVSIPNAGGCDTDSDGYGNHCDMDYDGNGVTDGTDFGSFFLPAFTGTPDPDTDHDCNGVTDGTDFGSFFLPAFTGSKAARGPSGLSCAGTAPCP